MLDAQWLQARVPIGRFGAPLYLYSTIGSTMDRAAELAAGGAPEGAVVLAAEQTAGRGRRGRSWDTPAGAGLAVSVVLRPPQARVRAIGLLGALAAVEALAALGPETPPEFRAMVKWPNDVLVGGKKIAGVLPEAGWSGDRLEHVVLGIGVNLRSIQPADQAPYDFPATSIEQSMRGPVEPNRLVIELLGGLETWYQRWLDGSAHPLWEQHLAYRSELVDVTGSVPAGRGRVLGLTAEGALRLVMEDGSQVLLENAAAQIRPVGSGLA